MPNGGSYTYVFYANANSNVPEVLYNNADPSTSTLSGNIGNGAWAGPLEFRSAGSSPPNPNDVIEVWQDSGGQLQYAADYIYIGDAGGYPVVTYSPGGPYEVTGTNSASATYPYTATTFCFLSGTLIATPDGEVVVENLKPGDIVSTADGGTRKVLWVGQQKVSTVFGSPKNYPIEICISALGDNMPKRPLRVSPGHSLLVDGAFPIASAMVNGSTVRQMTKDELPEVFTYYHVEVEDHALILAEGVPAETFLDAWSRRAFSNWQEYVDLYGEEERNVPPSDLHYKRVLMFDDLPQSLKDTLGEPLDAVGEQAA